MNEYLDSHLNGTSQESFLNALPLEMVWMKSDLNRLLLRKELIFKYSFAIPDDEALKLIAQYSPILEMGAGTGYWAKLLKEEGVDILAYDDFSWEWEKKWFEIQEGSVEIIPQHPNRTLFLCWPNYSTSFAYDCLKNYTGDTFIFIGEMGGCTGDDTFFEYLEEKFDLVQKHKLHQWLGIHDALYIFRAKDKI